MTIEEAIGMQLEIAKAREEFAEKHQSGEDASTAKVAKRIASEHRQIAQWLGELVRLRKFRPILEKIALKKICSELDILDGKDTNVPTNSALDHIHNVVRDDAYRRGYEQGKADAIKWIPIKTRPLTEEEKEEYPGWDYYLDCELPDDGQEILITYKNGNKKMVCEDTFFNDDCCYLDSGLEFGEDVLAWAEKPEPWKGEKADGQN